MDAWCQIFCCFFLLFFSFSIVEWFVWDCPQIEPEMSACVEAHIRLKQWSLLLTWYKTALLFTVYGCSKLLMSVRMLSDVYTHSDFSSWSLSLSQQKHKLVFVDAYMTNCGCWLNWPRCFVVDAFKNVYLKLWTYINICTSVQVFNCLLHHITTFYKYDWEFCKQMF